MATRGGKQERVRPCLAGGDDGGMSRAAEQDARGKWGTQQQMDRPPFEPLCRKWVIMKLIPGCDHTRRFGGAQPANRPEKSRMD